MQLKKHLLFFFFFLFWTVTFAQTRADYTWLDDVLNEQNCCTNQTVTAFPINNYSFVYVEANGECPESTSKLYFQDGQCWCTDGGGLDCLASYGLTLSDGIQIYDCEGATFFNVFTEYPWLANVVNQDDCCSNGQIELIDLGSFSFIYVAGNPECSNDLGKLYFETGELYCSDADNYNCLLAYGFLSLDRPTVWSCDGEIVDGGGPGVDGGGPGGDGGGPGGDGGGPGGDGGGPGGDGGGPGGGGPGGDGGVADGDTGVIGGGDSTPTSAFDEFNTDAVTISFDGDEITIVSDGTPNHTSPYWDTSNSLHIEPVVANADQMSPGTIRAGSYTLTVSAEPAKAASSSATGLGAIGIAVTGAPIFNDEEGPNISLSANVASGFDYAGGHNGPTGYHYHLESQDVDANTSVSHDDDQLVGILQDGFLIYGRRCNATGDHPTDLDESGGHTSATQHSDGEEFYHYHIINEIYISPYILLFGVDLQGTPNSIL